MWFCWYLLLMIPRHLQLQQRSKCWLNIQIVTLFYFKVHIQLYGTSIHLCSCTTRSHTMLAIWLHCNSLYILPEHVNIMSNKSHGETLTLDDMKKMTYTWQVARESMRLFPPIFGSFRKAVSDIEYEGFTIPRGWKVLFLASLLTFTHRHNITNL